MAKLKCFLAGVADTDVFTTTGEKILSSTTLVDSSITMSTTTEDIRAGKGAGLIGQYFHTSTFGLTLVDANFSMEYIALQSGSDISIGGNILTTEEVTITEENKITVTKTPVDFSGKGIIGWYRDTKNSADWTKITFTGKEATVTGVKVGDKVCVQFNTEDNALSVITVPSTIIPEECHVILTADLFASESGDREAASKVGQLVIEVPRFRPDGNLDLAMTMTGASQTNISGSALVVQDTTSCSGGGYYSIIKEQIFNANWYDGLIDLAIAGGTNFKTNSLVEVWGIYKNAKNKLISNDLLTLTNTTGTGKATKVTAAGLVTAKVKDANAPDYIKAILAEATAK